MYIMPRTMYTMTKRRWTIATARQRLPALIAEAAREPQRVYRRNQLVATVMSPEAAAAVPSVRPLAEELALLKQLCVEEDYTLPVAPRRDRANRLASTTRRSARGGR